MADENTSGLLDQILPSKWVIASLNKCMSKINNEIWVMSPDNTNVAEAAHALSNRDAINVHQKYNVPNWGRDKGLIARNVQSNKCKDDNYEEDNHNKENELALRLKELEYQEKDLALKEREVALREREAKIREMELYNCEKECQLKLVN
ncbi:hypothetical protein C1645_838007 [Glomus cerebriforme]|uniref:Uncharacterized protein n=1 Tax=Glomus cerebriforme TaxID=658196 RepID=A0A397S334_9GLOM|nr:hypothetical protein C1645_838007 [Glomus cerebriforme]